jgi:outer membrane protein, multidrug efflux system
MIESMEMSQHCKSSEAKTLIMARAASVLIAIALGGCVSSGPSTPRPSVQAPGDWQTPSGAADADLSDWWRIFEDESLDALIDDVCARNRDIHAAVARVDSYAAGYGIARAGRRPMIAAQAAASYDRETERVRNPLRQSPADNPTGLYQAGFTMAWEIDLWRRIGSEMLAARGAWQASIEDTRNITIMLQAQAASEYILLRTTQQRIAYAERNVGLQRETLKIVRDRFDAGLTGELDLHQAEMNLESTRAQLPSLKTQATESINALCLLTGRMPGEMEHLRSDGVIPESGRLPGILPAELLRRRPDIRAAEAQLRSQTARIAAARAGLLPSLALQGGFALLSSETDELASGAAEKYSIGPVLNWTLFSGGALRERIASEESLARAALAGYEQSVLAAFGECEDALAAYRNELERSAALRTAVAAAEKSVELARSLYISGLVDFQNVLDMQRQLAAYQDQMAYSAGMRAAALVAVYKAFGGGWDPVAGDFNTDE